MKYISRTLVIVKMVLALPTFGQVVIDRVLVDPAGNENSNAIPEIIEIVNLGDSTQDLTGWTLSSTPPVDEPDIWPFLDGFPIEPGQRLFVHWRAPFPGILVVDTFFTETSGITLLNNDGGDLALNSLEGIEHYVQWSKAGQKLEEAAVAAGKWTAGDFVPRPGED